MIDLKNIEKYYKIGNESFHALKNISLHVDEGEFVAIMGPSGSGKSTMMNILGLLDSFDSGEYYLNKRNVSDLSEVESAKVRNRELGFIFQSFNLMSRMTLLENVALPMIYAGVPAKKRNRLATIALEQVGLADRANHKTNEISGGQKQRAAIARAIVNHPAVLMADEPTGNLDSTNTKEIMKIFQLLNNEGTTVVMVTHEPEVAQCAKRIVTFRDGEILQDHPVENRTIL